GPERRRFGAVLVRCHLMEATEIPATRATSRIRVLPPELAEQIAAGEVVERPASVVKELVENALDAGATAVTIDLEAGGRRRIVVADDGSGMGRDDAVLAFDRHATSKIAQFEDLLRVATLGFRGEALAAIAAVSRVELVTSEGGGADSGWRVRIDGGRVIAAEPAARARGTTIEVASLFFNVPARRKFLKTASTELRRAVEVVQGYCLTRPEVRFELRHDGRTLLSAPPAGPGEAGTRERIRQLFGPAVADDLVEIATTRRGGESIAGFVGRPATARARRLFVFVNGRLLRDRALLAAFYGAVREEWRSEEAPSLFLFLAVPPEEVDVNVHPQKAEVRFRDPGLSERVRSALRDTLRGIRGEAEAPLRAVRSLAAPPSWEGLGGGSHSDDVFGRESEVPTPWPGTVAEPIAGWPTAPNPSASVATAKIAEVRYPAPAPVPLSGPGGGRASLHLLGQYKGSLLLLESPDALLLLDQHAAHERILYERLARSLASAAPAVQRLLEPRLLSLGPAEALRLGELAPELAPLGFHVEPLSGGDLALTAAPAGLSPDEAEALLVRLAGEDEGPGDSARLRERVLGSVAASRACRGAIKIHRPLSGPEMEQLVSQLLACEDPYTCPHGRPTLLEMRDAELERRFWRR
ncbi:MAG TPA: DNA mismatch repair endonuclease MutL, partial [Thermoanaerobaculia bacterium]|nr:DNA mismatch repair endonuclease MutL [Thermoanaerobaculia bacterium]